eukprot:1744747-Amphidinium_carterae.1
MMSHPMKMAVTKQCRVGSLHVYIDDCVQEGVCNNMHHHLMQACTSCPAAPSTIESGIERCLVEHYGDDVIKEVVPLCSLPRTGKAYRLKAMKVIKVMRQAARARRKAMRENHIPQPKLLGLERCSGWFALKWLWTNNGVGGDGW